MKQYRLHMNKTEVSNLYHSLDSDRNNYGIYGTNVSIDIRRMLSDIYGGMDYKKTIVCLVVDRHEMLIVYEAIRRSTNFGDMTIDIFLNDFKKVVR